jgi:transposase
MWCIPPKQDAAFVCAMENVLAVYKRPIDARFPVVCMDESSVQCIKEVREPLPAKAGCPARYDAEYERNGVAHLIQFSAPFVGWRRIEVADNHAAKEWAKGVRKLVEEDFAEAKRITLVMDNLSTHTGASLYKAFEPQVARRLLEKLEFVYTPKHGSWLNMAECEFSVLSRQCFSRRLPDINTVRKEVDAWTTSRNQAGGTINWRFTTEDARIKLKQLYPITTGVN